MKDSSSQPNPLQEVGQGVKDIIGGLLGLPVHAVSSIGDFLKDPGTALADSITPQGEISISSLLNIGGKRDRIVAERELQGKMDKLKLQNAQATLEQNQATVQSEKIKQALFGASLPAEQRTVAANAIAGPAISLPQGPTLGPDIERHAQLATLGLAPEQATTGGNEAAGNVLGSSLGIPSGDAQRLVANIGPEAAAKLALNAAFEKRQQDRLDARQARKDATSLRKKKDHEAERMIFSMVDDFLPPTTKEEVVPNMIGDTQVGTVKVKANVPRTPKDVQEAVARATEAYNGIQTALKGKEKRTLGDLSADAKARKGLEQYINAGLSESDAVKAALVDRVGLGKAFALPAYSGDANDSRKLQAYASIVADQVALIGRLIEKDVPSVLPLAQPGAAKAGIMAMLEQAGVPVQHRESVVRMAYSQLKARAGQ